MPSLLDKLQKRFMDGLTFETKRQKIGKLSCWDCLAKVNQLAILDGELLCKSCATSRVEYLEEKRKMQMRARAVLDIDSDEELDDL